MKHDPKFSADSLPANGLRASAADMRKALAFAAQVVERRNTIPILGYVLVECGEGVATFTGTNLDIEARAEFPAETVPGLKFVAPPVLLSQLVKFADGPVTLAVSGDNILTITADDLTATVRLICPPDEFPHMQIEAAGDFAVPADVLKRALGAALPCVSTEETRYYLNGVYMHNVGSGMTCVATDGHRLAKYDTEAPWPCAGAILPRQSAKVLHGALSGAADVSVTYAFTRATGPVEDLHSLNPLSRVKSDPAPEARVSKLAFKGDGWRIAAKIIDGTFPNYKRIIDMLPESPAITVALSYAALRRLPVRTGNWIATCLRIDGNAGRASVRIPDLDTEASMPITAKGEAFGMNLIYLRLLAAEAKNIRLEGSAPMDAFRVLTDDPALTQVLMPMQVS